MQTTLENLSNLERKLQVTVPAEHVGDKVKLKLNEIARTAKMPGFRPGKVPISIIKNTYGKLAHADVLEKLLQDTYVEAMQKEKLTPINSPDIKVISSNPNEPLVYTVIFEVCPEIKLVDLQQAEIEKPVSQLVDTDVDEALEKIRKSHATWKEIVDSLHKAQPGNQITIDFTTKICAPDETAEPKTETGVKFVLGDGSMWADFEQLLHGLGVGEEKQFVLQIPDTHIDKNIAGKNAEFVVKVHKICEPILPPLDDEFAAKMNVKEGGMAKLKEITRGHMERELQSELKDRFKQAIMDKFLELHPIEVPKSLIEQELKKNADDWQKRLIASHGTLENMPAFPRNDYEPKVKRNVALGLLLAELVKEHKLEVDQEEVHKKIKELITTYYDDSDEMLDKLLANPRHLNGIEAMLLEDKAIEHLATQVKPIEKSISYKDLIAKK